MKRLGLIVGFALIGIFLFGGRAHAVTGGDWQAGRIIDDGVFNNPSTMSIQDIQNFLNAKVPNCDTNGNGLYNGVQRKNVNPSYPPPYTCLKDYYENPSNHQNNLQGRGIPAGGVSAAQLIYSAAQSYHINPQVILTMLQKEQSLVTDDWPWWIQFRSAMGYGCPDTAPCDSQYYGLLNQIENAAQQFNWYAQNPNSFRHKNGQNNSILYNPNSGCGSSTVYISSQATAGLYNYTPYQPNQAALNNIYGTGDSCSAYGNRNFWRMFNDWFSNTRGFDYDWSVQDASISTGSSTVQGGQQATVTITAKNTGNQSWSKTNFPVRLGTFNPTDHSSALYDSSWVSGTRPAAMNEDVVLPGSNGSFTFKINPPNRAGSYDESFDLVAEGSTWLPHPYTLHLNINPSTYKWSMVSQSSSTGSFDLTPGQTAQFTMVARNTGNVTWTSAAPVRLATWAPSYRHSVFDAGDWVSAVRASQLQESSVAPGQTGTFVFNVRAPSQTGFYVERFNLVMEGVAWFDDPWMEFDINVR